jgi:uncharacterized protein (TIGR02246 family)
MKLFFLKKGILIFLTTLLPTAIFAQSKLDTLAIENIMQEEVEAWNKGDAETYSKHFAENGTFTNILGLFFTGHKAFLERHKQIFKGVFNKTILEQKTVSLRFIRTDVVIVETLTWILGFSKLGPPPGTHLDDKGRLYTRLLQVMVKEETDWKIVTYHNIDVKPGTAIIN